MLQIKCVVVGDGSVGKTCLLMRYCNNTFPETYTPTIFDNHSTEVTVGDQTVQLNLWDTAGQEDFEKLRPLSYPQTDVFIVCFSLVHRDSLINVTEKWIPELQEYCPDVPAVLVGTKLDLRQEQMQTKQKSANKQSLPVTQSEGQAIAKKTKAVKYVECSAKTDEGLAIVFDEAIRSVVFPSNNKTSKCNLL